MPVAARVATCYAVAIVAVVDAVVVTPAVVVAVVVPLDVVDRLVVVVEPVVEAVVVGELKAVVEELVVEAGLDDPALLATSLSILLEGAIVSAQVSRDASAAHHARRTASMLIGSSPGA